MALIGHSVFRLMTVSLDVGVNEWMCLCLSDTTAFCRQFSSVDKCTYCVEAVYTVY